MKIVGGSASNGTQPPPRNLGKYGLALWRTIQSEYGVSDSGGIEILKQICLAQDRVEQLAAQIESDGPVILVKNVMREHPALKAELAGRAFICRGLQRLGLNVEVIRPVGRPSGYSPNIGA